MVSFILFLLASALAGWRCKQAKLDWSAWMFVVICVFITVFSIGLFDEQAVLLQALAGITLALILPEIRHSSTDTTYVPSSKVIATILALVVALGVITIPLLGVVRTSDWNVVFGLVLLVGVCAVTDAYFLFWRFVGFMARKEKFH